jgi:hypothetical protein
VSQPSAGRGGKGGAGGTFPRCAERAAFAGLFFDESGKLVEEPLSAQVTVLSVDACASVACPSGSPSAATRFILADPQQAGLDGGTDGARWTLVVLLAGLHTGLIAVEAHYDLTLAASLDSSPFSGHGLSQTIVLSHGPALVLALSTQHARFVRPPALEAFDVSLSKDAVTCEDPLAGIFGTRKFSLRASHGGQSLVIPCGGNAYLGDLYISLVAFDTALNDGASDLAETLQLGIVQLPTP